MFEIHIEDGNIRLAIKTVAGLIFLALLRTLVLWFDNQAKSLTFFQANICRKHSKTFFFASLLYPASIRTKVFIFYAFARVADDLIDEAPTKEMQIQNLEVLQSLVENMYSTTLLSKKGNMQTEKKEVEQEERFKTDGFYKALARILTNLNLNTKDTEVKLNNDKRSSIEYFAAQDFVRIFVDFRKLVERQKIPHWALKLLLDGFQHDASTSQIEDESELLKYCLGVASSIGIVCSYMFVDHNGDQSVLNKFDPNKNPLILKLAASLGIGMQLTNIARDILTDAGMGRTYVPNTWLNEMNVTSKDFIQQIEQKNDLANDLALKLIRLAETYYSSGWDGIKLLPTNIRWAIGSALLIYRDIGFRIKDLLEAHEGYPKRAFTTKTRKLQLILKAKFFLLSGMRPKFNVLTGVRNETEHLLNEFIAKH